MVRLQAQPAKVLGLLLEAPGEIVTPEALREAVWGSEVNVDVDRSLNHCLSQIRGALGDSAESPAYVATLPKRGYQFLAPVRSLDSPALERRAWLGPLALVAVAAAGVGAWVWWKIGDTRERIAVVRFDNETGDASYGRMADTISDALTGELTGHYLTRYGVIGNAAILRRPRAERDLRRIAADLGVKYIVLGQVQMREGAPSLLAHLIRMPEQTHLQVVRLAPGDPVRTAVAIRQGFDAALASPH